MAKVAAPPQPLWLSFSTAGLGGIIGWCVVHPFNTLAVRMNLAAVSAQAAGPGGAAAMPSFLPFARDSIRQRGVLALYTGLSAGITRQVFYATSRFGLYEVFRDWIERRRALDLSMRLGAGVLSGCCAALISCPAEVSLVRMSNDATLPAADRRNYRHIGDAAARILREEGVAAFWRGSVPFMQRAALVGATQVATYDQFRGAFQRHLGLAKDGSANVIAASMAAGLLYSVITNPFETAKNRMAFQRRLASGALEYTGTAQTIAAVARREGALALWSGFAPYYLRCGGHTVAMFVAVEQLRKLATARTAAHP